MRIILYLNVLDKVTRAAISCLTDYLVEMKILKEAKDISFNELMSLANEQIEALRFRI